MSEFFRRDVQVTASGIFFTLSGGEFYEFDFPGEVKRIKEEMGIEHPITVYCDVILGQKRGRHERREIGEF